MFACLPAIHEAFVRLGVEDLKKRKTSAMSVRGLLDALHANGFSGAHG